MNDASFMISYSEAQTQTSAGAKLLCEGALAVALGVPSPTALASNIDYLADSHHPEIAQMECARDIVSRALDAKQAIARKIEMLRAQMPARDFRNAEIFLRDMPTAIANAEIEVDTYKYLTIGWELARFRNVSVSFSNERIHAVGQYRMEEIMQSFSSAEMDKLYSLISKILYA